MALQRDRHASKRRICETWMMDYSEKIPRERVYFKLLRELQDPTSVGHAIVFQNTMRVDREL